jgi:hypothetical protein
MNLNEIEQLCGYVGDGSDVTLTISQDDATRTWIVKVGKASYTGRSMRDALREAYKAEFGRDPGA